MKVARKRLQRADLAAPTIRTCGLCPCVRLKRPVDTLGLIRNSLYLQVAERVDGRAVHAHLEVQVRPEAVARAADVADRLALRDGGAVRDGDRRLVRIRGGKPVAVVDHDEV